jgi:sigma-54 dependent transcriptional regulator, acetoin dehydrogenase operon transcriptional activator AcoR
MEWSIDRKINLGFTLALALLIAISVLSFRSINLLIDTIHLVTHSHAVIDTLEELFSELKDAQRGERGYVLTGRENYLQPYNEALALIEQELIDLKHLLPKDKNQRSRLAALEALVQDNLAELEQAIRLRREEGFKAGVAVIQSGEGKHLMDSIERIIVQMQDQEETRLQRRSAQAELRARATLVTIGIGNLMAIGLVALAIFLIRRDITERKRAERALQDAHNALEIKVQERTAELAQANAELHLEISERKRSEAKLAVTLEQIETSHEDLRAILDQLPLGIVMTDEAGCITFLSKSAGALFERQPEEVLGQRWEKLLAVDEPGKSQLQAMSELPLAQRVRMPVSMQAHDGRRYWMEVEIHNDPRAGKRRIFSLYDASEIYDLRRLLDEKAQFENMVGKSNLMRRAYQQIADVAKVDATVLIEGETGTGKELVARALHAASHRRDKPFVPVNCAGLTDSLLASQLFGHKKGAFTGAVADQQGLFEAAEGGTLFLDEIGDISAMVQTSLLRVLQEKEINRLGESRPRKIDVRVIAATHRDLSEQVKQGHFRADLFYRIRVARIQVPPLRARREDIPLLAGWFLRQSRAATGKPVQDISQDAMQALMDYAWPGNVRELKSAIEFAVIHCKGQMLRISDLAPEIREAVAEPTLKSAAAPPNAPEDEERQRLLEALRRAGGNRAAAARLLGIGRTTLYRRLASLNLPSE